jgi:hypothetical protein
MKALFRNLFVLAVSSPVWTARAADTLAQSSGAAASDFVRLVRLPSPTIIDSATPYRGGGNEATNILDGMLRSEYASHAKGTNTFIQFDFGRPTLIAGLRHVDRNDPATIVSSELIFMDESDRVIARTPVAHDRDAERETRCSRECLSAHWRRRANEYGQLVVKFCRGTESLEASHVKGL